MEVGELLPVGVTLVVVTVALAFGLQVVGDIRTTLATDNTGANCGQNSSGGSGAGVNYNGCGVAYNATRDGQVGLSKLTGKLPTIGLVIAAVVIIAILVRGFSKAA